MWSLYQKTYSAPVPMRNAGVETPSSANALRRAVDVRPRTPAGDDAERDAEQHPQDGGSHHELRGDHGSRDSITGFSAFRVWNE